MYHGIFIALYARRIAERQRSIGPTSYPASFTYETGGSPFPIAATDARPATRLASTIHACASCESIQCVIGCDAVPVFIVSPSGLAMGVTGIGSVTYWKRCAFGVSKPMTGIGATGNGGGMYGVSGIYAAALRRDERRGALRVVLDLLDASEMSHHATPSPMPNTAMSPHEIDDPPW